MEIKRLSQLEHGKVYAKIEFKRWADYHDAHHKFESCALWYLDSEVAKFMDLDRNIITVQRQAIEDGDVLIIELEK